MLGFNSILCFSLLMEKCEGHTFIYILIGKPFQSSSEILQLDFRRKLSYLKNSISLSLPLLLNRFIQGSHHWFIFCYQGLLLKIVQLFYVNKFRESCSLEFLYLPFFFCLSFIIFMKTDQFIFGISLCNPRTNLPWIIVVIYFYLIPKIFAFCHLEK